MSGVTNYPNASREGLKAQYVGRMLRDVDGPAAIIDVAVARKNCQLMLDAADALGVFFRSHVKTHKTTELTKFQVGEQSNPVRLVVSTLAEAEQLQPYLEECKANGRSIDLIYGLPVQPSSFKRLTALGKSLGTASISVLVDNPDIIPFLSRYRETTSDTLGVFIKLDTGNNRAGILPESQQFKDLVAAVHAAEHDDSIGISLRGFYSHLGHSYSSDSTNEAMDYLAQEVERCGIAAAYASTVGKYSERRFLISVGATPTTTAAQNLTSPDTVDPTIKRVKELFDRSKESYDIELHAGAYVTLDMQQLAAHARPTSSHLSFNDIALTVLAEVGSLYPHREKPEALAACGSLCLGREACRNYPGWGVVTPWLEGGEGIRTAETGWYDPEGDRKGWIMDRISQEHGILAWHGSRDKVRPLKIGEKIRIWPNHCCICIAGFSYVLVVDSSLEGAERDRVQDVWFSWRGW
ncbi:type III pyridoxal 5-phosphate-dependent enzyme domain-containing protein, alanine racemase domain [Histoplasma ohiense]|nr:type III pyridoxal 5-phosphate-dependent enzyme domain-containing protein, alanine racemase domain [Histoplasma ohiense (nom. inval.)]